MSKINKLLLILVAAIFIIAYVYFMALGLARQSIVLFYFPLAIIIGLIVYTRPIWGIFLVLVFSPLKTFGDELLLANRLLGIWVVFSILAPRLLIHRQQIRWTGIEKPVILMVLGMSISFFRTPNTASVFCSILSLISLYGLVFVVVNTVDDRSHLQNLLWFFTISGIVPIIVAFTQRAEGLDPNRVYTRFSGTFTISTGLGSFLIPVILMALAFSFYPGLSRMQRFLIFGLYGGASVAIVLTLSRGAIFGVIIGFFVLYMLLRRHNVKNQPFIIAMVILLFAGGLWLSWSSVQGRVFAPIIEIINSGTSSSVTINQRPDELSLIIPITLDNNLMGTGIGNYARAASRYRNIYGIPDLPKVPHNIFLYFFGMVGIFGAAGFIWLVFLIIRHIKINHRLMTTAYPELEFFVYIGALASLAAYIPNAITHNPLFSNEMWLVLGFLLTSLRLGLENTQYMNSQKEINQIQTQYSSKKYQC